MKIKFFDSTNYHSPKKNIFLLEEKQKVSFKWLVGQLVFMLWMSYVRIIKRDFSQSYRQIKKAVGHSGFSGNTLDIGGGHGGFSELWHPHKADELYFIADPLLRQSVQDLELYKKNRIIFVQAHGEKLPFSNNSFDNIIIAATLDHMDDPNTAMKEAARVLTKNGKIFIAQKIESKGMGYLTTHDHTFNRSKLTQLIEQQFRIISTDLSSDKQVLYIWAVKNGA